MKITTSETDDEICLHFEHQGNGLINIEANTETVLNFIKEAKNKQVVFDLAKVPYSTSPILAVFIMVARELRPQRITLRNAVEHISSAFKTFEIYDLFDFEEPGS